VLAVLRQHDSLRARRARLRLPKHILVDEFQDVSPEIVDWLAKTLAVQVRDGGEEVSLTCIGDDCQSIYGWRGSHPIFLMEFARYFPSALQGKVVLHENFRSLQPIIDAAEAALQDVRHKIAKHGESFLKPRDGALRGSVCLSEARLAWGGSRRGDASAWRVFSQFVGSALRALSESGHLQACFKGRQTLSVFILARKNATAKQIQPQRLGEQLIASLVESGIEGFRKAQVHICTFHSSKGLEADFVLLIEDSLPPDQHQLRELVFGQSPFLGGQAGSYLQNVTDEGRRLAYVALTRARFGVLWLPQVETRGPDEQDAAGEQRRSDTYVSPQGCFALVKRSLHALPPEHERRRST
jgi:superfamily I DNA/RNA helicase